MPKFEQNNAEIYRLTFENLLVKETPEMQRRIMALKDGSDTDDPAVLSFVKAVIRLAESIMEKNEKQTKKESMTVSA